MCPTLAGALLTEVSPMTTSPAGAAGGKAWLPVAPPDGAGPAAVAAAFGARGTVAGGATKGPAGVGRLDMS